MSHLRCRGSMKPNWPWGDLLALWGLPSVWGFTTGTTDMKTLKIKAPLTTEVRAQLRADARNIRAAADRKQVSLDRFEELRESRMAQQHFELGCWLFRFTKLRGLTPAQYLQERVDIVTRLFLAGLNNPRYDFFTVFDFGERQFDSIFEDGEAKAVIGGVRQNISSDASGLIALAFHYFGWDVESPQGALTC